MGISERILRMSKRELRERVQQLETLEAAPIVLVGRLLTYTINVESDFGVSSPFDDPWKTYIHATPRATMNVEFELDRSQFAANVMQRGKYRTTQYQIILKEIPSD